MIETFGLTDLHVDVRVRVNTISVDHIECSVRLKIVLLQTDKRREICNTLR